MPKEIKELKGANFDIDLTTPPENITWKQDKCPWNEAESIDKHKCALKNVSICPYFCGIKLLDTILCSYPEKRNSE